MKTIQKACVGWMTLGLVLVTGMAKAQKRLPIGGSTVPPVGGQTTSSSNGPDNSRNAGGFGSLSMDGADLSVQRNLEALRLSRMNAERHRVLTVESAQLLQMTAELHAKIANDTQGGSPTEMQKQLDAIEKLARDVKDRMKGAR
jgi:hypothetical protein